MQNYLNQGGTHEVDKTNFEIRGDPLEFNPLPPSDAVWEQIKLFQRIFLVQYCQNSKNTPPLETYNLII